MGDIREKIEESHKKWRNPYKDAYVWIKVELLDIRGIADALAGREHVVKQ